MHIIKIFISLLSLLIGGLIYIGFRDENLLMFDWFNNLGLNSYIVFFRTELQHIDLPNWVIYSLPDGLWVLSYMILINEIWKSKREPQYYIWSYSLPIIAITLEITQIFTSYVGTFDIYDLLCYICPILFFLVNDIYNYKK